MGADGCAARVVSTITASGHGYLLPKGQFVALGEQALNQFPDLRLGLACYASPIDGLHFIAGPAA